jgi:HD-GYP domain-containing protein (c-di-GMP phosphodiesterase class II)
LRRERLHKPAISHNGTMATLLQRSQGQFDPALLRALQQCHTELERIFAEMEE